MKTFRNCLEKPQSCMFVGTEKPMLVTFWQMLKVSQTRIKRTLALRPNEKEGAPHQARRNAAAGSGALTQLRSVPRRAASRALL